MDEFIFREFVHFYYKNSQRLGNLGEKEATNA
ncbi:hypothetical protein JOC48_003036 [Aquibacillus albus]|uniref:Uncharacterized protein n=1 Tax=Aquibacillus albus TaxID=1168171 RepID=A0ABS2N318_9BACI|nr:hypothetical protein [Aquibacillus albus]